MASILSIRDCTSGYNVFLSSLIKLGFNKITFIIVRIVLNALVRDLWPTLYFDAFHFNHYENSLFLLRNCLW